MMMIKMVGSSGLDRKKLELAINKKVVCSGRIPKQNEVAAGLTTGVSGEPQP